MNNVHYYRSCYQDNPSPINFVWIKPQFQRVSTQKSSSTCCCRSVEIAKKKLVPKKWCLVGRCYETMGFKYEGGKRARKIRIIIMRINLSIMIIRIVININEGASFALCYKYWYRIPLKLHPFSSPLPEYLWHYKQIWAQKSIVFNPVHRYVHVIGAVRKIVWCYIVSK